MLYLFNPPENIDKWTPISIENEIFANSRRLKQLSDLVGTFDTPRYFSLQNSRLYFKSKEDAIMFMLKWT